MTTPGNPTLNVGPVNDGRAARDDAGRDRRSSVLAWGATGVVAIAAVLVAVEGVLAGTASADLVWLLLPVFYAVVGAIVASHRQARRVGWLLIAIGGAIAFEAVHGLVPLDVPPSQLTLMWMLVLVSDQVSWMVWLFPLFLLLYVFPTGRLLSPRWRWVPILEIVMFVILTIMLLLSDEIGPVNELWLVPKPYGPIDAAVFDSPFYLVPWVLGLAALALGSVASMVMRYRRAGTLERTQLKWVLYAVVMFALVYAFMLATSGWSDDAVIPLLALTLGVAGIAVAIMIAVLRFHLYEIDVVISKSIVFGVLAVFIGGVYVLIVVGLGQVVGGGDDPSFGLSVVATATVAIAFQPVRGLVGRWANRLVYGKRATPYEVLARFSHRAEEESDEDVLGRIPHLIVDGTGASVAALWVRSNDGFLMASVWPDTTAQRTVAGVDVFEDPLADLSLPVFHDGELLGGISAVNARGSSFSPPERELLGNLAGGLGLTLRNSQLTSTLRRQVKDLQRSRDRVVSAADEARRSLEHDLDSGPQQQLVAVKVKLGPVRMLAEKAGAVKTATVLADIESQTADAIQAVRNFAAGIYPPLLGAEGLAVALGQEIQKAAIPVELVVEGVGRYPRDVESAVYFSILEALQNTAKYAEASQAVVKLVENNGDLLFEVRDDGKGFESATVVHGSGLNGIGDRIDTIGGTWDIASSPSHGTVVSGSVPISDRARAVVTTR